MVILMAQKSLHSYGIAVNASKNSYIAGELDYHVRRLARIGLVAFATTNGSYWRKMIKEHAAACSFIISAIKHAFEPSDYIPLLTE